jgi:hypothetical protein
MLVTHSKNVDEKMLVTLPKNVDEKKCWQHFRKMLMKNVGNTPKNVDNTSKKCRRKNVRNISEKC